MIVYFTLGCLIVMLIFSFIFNTISIFVFANKKLRQVGCDLYRLILTIVSEIDLVVLFLRFLYTMIMRLYIVENILFAEIG